MLCQELREGREITKLLKTLVFSRYIWFSGRSYMCWTNVLSLIVSLVVISWSDGEEVSEHYSHQDMILNDLKLTYYWMWTSQWVSGPSSSSANWRYSTGVIVLPSGLYILIGEGSIRCTTWHRVKYQLSVSFITCMT